MKKNFTMKNKIYPKTYGRRRGRMKKSKINKYMKQLDYFKYSSNKLNTNQILEIGSGNGQGIKKLLSLTSKNIISIEVSDTFRNKLIQRFIRCIKKFLTNIIDR